jgi:hypothetical protein
MRSNDPCPMYVISRHSAVTFGSRETAFTEPSRPTREAGVRHERLAGDRGGRVGGSGAGHVGSEVWADGAEVDGTTPSAACSIGGTSPGLMEYPVLLRCLGCSTSMWLAYLWCASW